MLNYKDCTLKPYLKNRVSVEEKLIELGAVYDGIEYQQDFYFRVSNGKLKYRKGTLKTLITHYERFILDNIEKTSVYRYDINPSEEDVQKLFSNYDVIGQVSKSRSLFQLNNITIHLDKLENGEEFIEVEAKDFDERFDELVLKNQCLLLFEDLRISYQEHLPTGYLNTSIS